MSELPAYQRGGALAQIIAKNPAVTLAESNFYNGFKHYEVSIPEGTDIENELKDAKKHVPFVAMSADENIDLENITTATYTLHFIDDYLDKNWANLNEDDMNGLSDLKHGIESFYDMDKVSNMSDMVKDNSRWDPYLEFVFENQIWSGLETHETDWARRMRFQEKITNRFIEKVSEARNYNLTRRVVNIGGNGAETLENRRETIALLSQTPRTSMFFPMAFEKWDNPEARTSEAVVTTLGMLPAFYVISMKDNEEDDRKINMTTLNKTAKVLSDFKNLVDFDSHNRDAQVALILEQAYRSIPESDKSLLVRAYTDVYDFNDHTFEF